MLKVLEKQNIKKDAARAVARAAARERDRCEFRGPKSSFGSSDCNVASACKSGDCKTKTGKKCYWGNGKCGTRESRERERVRERAEERAAARATARVVSARRWGRPLPRLHTTTTTQPTRSLASRIPFGHLDQEAHRSVMLNTPDYPPGHPYSEEQKKWQGKAKEQMEKEMEKRDRRGVRGHILGEDVVGTILDFADMKGGRKRKSRKNKGRGGPKKRKTRRRKKRKTRRRKRKTRRRRKSMKHRS
jgi:hypothetical protein